eukprot:CAMPEP_0179186950 /NCGR_PEP_ID=MMETSP0796-20121207/92743_1 /TAXON_ID=73915 /ORGANISM="Pyrodinium bahamense, Strain pbaha01" /LENGTH=221 /DNA_ID=CAMNT_0020890975 /DNA_START=62 /DNA_END=725 /DNA_ORIENTATION=-
MTREAGLQSQLFTPSAPAAAGAAGGFGSEAARRPTATGAAERSAAVLAERAGDVAHGYGGRLWQRLRCPRVQGSAAASLAGLHVLHRVGNLPVVPALRHVTWVQLQESLDLTTLVPICVQLSPLQGSIAERVHETPTLPPEALDALTLEGAACFGHDHWVAEHGVHDRAEQLLRLNQRPAGQARLLRAAAQGALPRREAGLLRHPSGRRREAQPPSGRRCR